MVTVAQIIQYLYPTAVSLQDFVVEQHGNAETLTHWNTALGTRPTNTDIENARSAAETYYANKATAENTAAQDLQALKTSALTMIGANDTYVALSNPSAVQSVAQIKALTQQSTAIIKALMRLIAVNNN
jgi:hypothetical protein